MLSREATLAALRARKRSRRLLTRRSAQCLHAAKHAGGNRVFGV